MKLAVIAIFFCGLFNANAQDSTRVKFIVRGSEVYFVKIDGMLQPIRNKMMVSRGEHQIEIWSPKYQTHRGKLQTGNLDSTTYVAILRHDAGYLEHMQKVDNFNRAVFLKRNLPVVLFTISTVSFPFLHRWRLNAHETYVKDEFLKKYNIVGTDNSDLQYYTANVTYFTTIGVGVASAIAFAAFRKSVARSNKPIYRQQNPFTLEYVEISLNSTYAIPQAGMRLTF